MQADPCVFVVRRITNMWLCRFWYITLCYVIPVQKKSRSLRGGHSCGFLKVTACSHFPRAHADVSIQGTFSWVLWIWPSAIPIIHKNISHHPTGTTTSIHWLNEIDWWSNTSKSNTLGFPSSPGIRWLPKDLGHFISELELSFSPEEKTVAFAATMGGVTNISYGKSSQVFQFWHCDLCGRMFVWNKMWATTSVNFIHKWADWAEEPIKEKCPVMFSFETQPP